MRNKFFLFLFSLLFLGALWSLEFFATSARAATSVSTAEVQYFPPPANLSGLSPSTSRINLSWNSVNYAIFYKVYRGGSFIGSVSAGLYSDTDLMLGTSYAYSVSAVNVFGGESFLWNWDGFDWFRGLLGSQYSETDYYYDYG